MYYTEYAMYTNCGMPQTMYYNIRSMHTCMYVHTCTCTYVLHSVHQRRQSGGAAETYTNMAAAKYTDWVSITQHGFSCSLSLQPTYLPNALINE